VLSPNVTCAVTALFIVGMVWLRTRMHYAREARGVRSLTGAGRGYFAALGLLLAAGWLAAPLLARSLGAAAPGMATVARVVWFLASYYLFIPVHLLMKARGVPVFRATGLPEEGWRTLRH
jgi:hypothetical protein